MQVPSCRSHQGGLTFYREDAGAGCRASAVHRLAHVLALVLGKGLWQVEAVCLASLDVLIVLAVLQHLALKPPGHLRLGLPCDLDGEAHGFRVHHRLVLKRLFEPRGPRPGVVVLVVIGRRAVDDAALLVDLVLLLLQERRAHPPQNQNHTSRGRDNLERHSYVAIVH